MRASAKAGKFRPQIESISALTTFDLDKLLPDRQTFALGKALNGRALRVEANPDLPWRWVDTR